jgi:hypothetical protein
VAENNTLGIDTDEAQEKGEPKAFGRGGFVAAGGILGLAAALVFLTVAPARELAAPRPPSVELTATAAPGPAAPDLATPAPPSAAPVVATPAPAPGFPSPAAPSHATTAANRPSPRSSWSPTRDYAPSSTSSYSPGYAQDYRPSVWPAQRGFIPPDSPDKTVHVRDYVRKDGTYVRAHMRRPPRR